jgi:3-deoxy-D-manno-octulosonate 8-phosphate phosphatase (KDO 8-P phosphatase)
MGRTEANPAAAEVPPGIELLVLDVDGVLTDGRIVLDAEGRELKRFDVQDGAGIKYWQRVGKRVAFLSGRSSPAVVARAAELGVTLVRQNAKQKLPAYESLLKELHLGDAQVAVMGDDLPDLPLMRRCGFAVAPPEAVEEVRQAAGLVTRRRAGRGAVREAIEHMLKGTGLWEEVLKRYRQESP